MPSQRSYDDIVRETVPLPDSSYRPKENETVAAETRGTGPRVIPRFPDDGDDQSTIVQRVRDALVGLQGADLADLDVALEGGRAEIGGSVADENDRDRIVRAVSDVPGVIAVIDTIRVRAV